MFEEIFHLKKNKENYSNNVKAKSLQNRRDESRLLLAKSLDIQNELEIQSQIQSKENNIQIPKLIIIKVYIR